MLFIMSIREFLFLTIVMGMIACIYSYLTPHTVIKKQEEALTYKEKIYLYSNRFVHYTTSFYFRFYPFLVKYTLFYDIIYIILLISVGLQWILFSECLLSSSEKKILDPSYVRGQNTRYEPYIELLSSSQLFYILFQSLVIIALLVVIIRTGFYYYKKMKK
jgi:hypothetical protein